MAILFGTTGEGETLPVLVDQYGNLLAKGIDGTTGPEGPQGPKGDDGSEGPQGPKGDNGTDGTDGTDGEGIPKPYGDEGSYLWIKDGAPAWSAEGDPPPPPTGGVTIEMQSAYYPWSCYNSSQQTVIPPNQTPDEYCRTQPSWQLDDNTIRNGVGSEKGIVWNKGETEDLLFNLLLENPFGKVLEIWCTAFYDYTGPSQNPGNLEVVQTEPNVVPIRTSIPFQDKQGNGSNNTSFFKISYLINRDLSSYPPQIIARASYTQYKGTVAHGWRLVDPGYYALKQQIQYEKRIREINEALKNR